MESIYGVPISVSDLAVTIEPNRPHKHRRNQSKAYHERVQKKWRKRFGTKQVPGCYAIGSALGFGQRMVMHPAIYDKLKIVAGWER